MIDVARARRETPACEHVTHLNNAGSSLLPQPVLDAVVGHLELEARVGGYEAHEQNEAAIERFYGAAAALLGARPEEIAFCSSATRAWDMAFYGFRFEPGDRILTAVAEYISNYIAYLQVAERTGAEVVPVPNDEHGQVSVDALRELVDERVKLIARPESRTCSTPARQSVSFPSTSTRLAATSSRRPDASSCAGRAVPACSTCARACSRAGRPWRYRAQPQQSRHRRRRRG